jgi:hypothetical protein
MVYGQYAFFSFSRFDIFWRPGSHLEIFMVGVSDEATLHITRVFDLTYFSRSQRSMFVKNIESCHVSSLFGVQYNVLTVFSGVQNALG